MCCSNKNHSVKKMYSDKGIIKDQGNSDELQSLLKTRLFCFKTIGYMGRDAVWQPGIQRRQ